MIGDWVMVNNSPCKIYSINEHGVFTDKGTSYYSREEIEDITITHEILEKNGFSFGLTPLEEALSELDDFDDDFKEDNEDTKVRLDVFFKEHWSYTDEGVELHLYSSDDLKKGNLFVDELRLNRHLEFAFQDFLYVHELQHVLRLCGLDEFADNFNI